MPRARSTLVIALLLVISSIPLAMGSEGRAVSCGTTDLSALPGQFTVNDQACEQVALGIQTPGTVIEFELDANANFDFLVFKANSLPVYSNEQSYRSSSIWAEETVFENLVGTAVWHWTVPTDQSATNWFVVIDNMAHVGDDGQGAQGGSALIIDLEITFPPTSMWTLHDGLIDLGVNDHALLLDSALLTLDEGTALNIRGIPMHGDPDIFLLTESQRESYLDGNSPEFRVSGADLLQLTSDTTVTYTVDSTHANQPLYLYADNEQGPNGGGDGQTAATFTVVVTILPILDATITSAMSTGIDVGESITVSANSTPNLSNQVDTSAYEWDLDSDGTIDATGNWAETSWSAPGNYSVQLRAHGTDGRTDISSMMFDVQDISAPTAVIVGGSSIIRGYGESFTLTSSSTDNHQIQTEEWRVDGVLDQSDNGTQNTFTHSFSQGGNHTIELRAYDESGWSGSMSIIVNVRDITPPQMDEITGPSEVMVGESKSWTVGANDPESATLSWSWDFNHNENEDSLGSATDDAEASGALVEWTFDKAGTYYITATVTNQENLTFSKEHLVVVEAQPSSESTTSSVIVYSVGAIVVIALIVGGFFVFRSYQSRQQHQEMMAAEAAMRAEEEAKSAHQPDRDEQLSMFQNRGSGGFSARGSVDEISQIAGVGSAYGAGQVHSATTGVADEGLLDAFAEPEPAPESVPEPAPEPKAETQTVPSSRAGVEIPDSVSKGTVISSGIELPGVLSKIVEKEAPQEEAPAPTVESTTTTEMVGVCSGCSERYAVDMPTDLQEAQIDCPNCGVRNVIRR